MPHIAIKMYPGRDEKVKMALAEKMRDTLAEELAINTDIVSVSIEDVPPEKWKESMQVIPDDAMCIGVK